MSLASNLLQLIFSLVVGIASLIGALFIIGFLLAVPRNDFDDDDHDTTQPILFIPQPEPSGPCEVQTGLGILPPTCVVMETNSSTFNNTACDNTLCDGCSVDDNVTCCCRTNTTTSLEFTCEGANPRTRLQPDSCTCQPCGDIFVLSTFQIISSSGNTIQNPEIMILDDTPPTSLTIDSAGLFSTFRRVGNGMILVNASATGHISRQFTVDLIPPGPLRFIFILSAAVQEVLGSNENRSLNFSVGQIAEVTVPENTVVFTSNNNIFNGSVTARTVFFSMEQSMSSVSYSDEFPREVTTTDGGVITLYATRLLARTELIDENGSPLSISRALSISVDFNSQLTSSSGDRLSLLLYNEITGMWTVQSQFNFTSPTLKRKRQATNETTTGITTLPSTNVFWAVSLALDNSQICYLQVRTFQGENELNGVTVSAEEFTTQFGDPFFYRSVAVTGSGSAGNPICMEVLCGSEISGRISAELNGVTLEPSTTQPSSVTINGTTVTFTGTTEGNPPSPFYTSQELCTLANANSFVRFELPVDPIPVDITIPPTETALAYWFIRVEVLSCFDSNRVSTISVNNENKQASFFTTTVSPSNDQVDIPTAISPCAGQVTRRTVCVEAYNNSVVRIQVEQNSENTASGQLCYLSELTDLLNSPTRNERNVEIDLATLGSNSNTMAGVYFGTNRFATLDDCLNPSVGDLDTPLRGSFAQFECFDHQADSVPVTLPAGCTSDTEDGMSYLSQTCSQVPCTTDTGNCANDDAQCCYQTLSTSNVTIECSPVMPLNLAQPQTCFCMPCGDVPIDVIVTVTSSFDGSPVIGAMVDTDTDPPFDTTMTDILGMFTISALVVSNRVVTFSVRESMHMPSEQYEVKLIPPGPIRISLVLRNLVIAGHGQTDNEIIDVGGIANVTFNNLIGNIVNSSTIYIAEENRRSFDARLPPDVVTSDDTFYVVRIIAATRLFNDTMTLSSSAQVNTMFTTNGGQPNASTFSLLSLAPNTSVWMVESSVDISPEPSTDGITVTASANLTNTELLWAIASPVSSEICYVQVRTFRRDDNPLGDVLVEVLQFINQFGQPFFFKSSRVTGDNTGPVSNSACLPVLCNRNNTGMIRALYHVYLDANSSQPGGFTPSDKAVNIDAITGSSSGPLFTTMAECMAPDHMEFARFDLPIANPPPTNIEPTNNDNGFVFLRVSWYDCFDSNRVSTISASPSNELSALFSSTVSETGEINNGIIDDPTVSGMRPITCSSAPMNNLRLTTRTACIQVDPNSNVTLQVELNSQSSMHTEDNEFCSLNLTVTTIRESSGTSTSNTRLTFDLAFIRSSITDEATLNDIGIFFDPRSANVAYDRCMNPTNSSTAELNSTIALFSCYTY